MIAHDGVHFREPLPEPPQDLLQLVQVGLEGSVAAIVPRGDPGVGRAPVGQQERPYKGGDCMPEQLLPLLRGCCMA